MTTNDSQAGSVLDMRTIVEQPGKGGDVEAVSRNVQRQQRDQRPPEQRADPASVDLVECPRSYAVLEYRTASNDRMGHCNHDV